MSQAAQVAAALAQGAIVLTPNLRAARHWTSRVNALGTPEQGAVPPKILPWGGWTAALYQQTLVAGVNDRVLLNPVQTAALWDDVVGHTDDKTLRSLRSLAALCEQAHSLLHRYGGVSRLLHLREASVRQLSPDARQFRLWMAQVEARCVAEGLLPAPALESALSETLRAGHFAPAGESPGQHSLPPLALAQSYLLLGFHRLTPAQELLRQALLGQGAAVEFTGAHFDEDRPEPANPTLLRAPDSRGEYLSLAHWLRGKLEDTLATVPIAVVVPDLEASRPALERALREVVAPELQDVAARRAAPWEFSTGLPLSSMPMVAHALLLIQWTGAPLTVASVSELLRSPFVSLGITSDLAGQLDAAILRDNRRLRPEWTIPALLRRCGDRFPAMTNLLRGWHARYQEQLRGQKTYAAWVSVARELLRDAGWPGPREQKSEDFQLAERWNELLDQISSLDLFGKPVHFSEFIAQVEQWARQTTFAPENTGAPVQFVTPAEAAGSTAAHLWCAHADEPRWSGKRSPHPLLPWPLQAELGMPGVDPASDCAEARADLDRLQRSAGDVTFSYAETDENGELRPSTLVKELPGLTLQTAPPALDALPTAALDEVEDTDPLPALPDGTLRGGVGVLQSQAACAFRAFAERRLFSTALENSDLGMDARQRGSLLHAVLESFWKETRTHARLLELLSRDDLRETLLRHIDVQVRSGTEDLWSLAYLEVQRTRLCNLLMRWLEHESARRPFEVLDAERQVKGVEIGPLRMDVRVDRIDRVTTEDGTALVLIDYKTGTADVSSWLGGRPEEPQLPLYAVAAGLGDVRAIAFGRVKPGRKNLGLRSFPQKSDLLFHGDAGNDPESFAEQMENWNDILESLAADFHAGTATVGPREYPATCTYCEQRMLCRLNPELLEVLAEEDAAEVID